MNRLVALLPCLLAASVASATPMATYNPSTGEIVVSGFDASHWGASLSLYGPTGSVNPDGYEAALGPRLLPGQLAIGTEFPSSFRWWSTNTTLAFGPDGWTEGTGKFDDPVSLGRVLNPGVPVDELELWYRGGPRGGNWSIEMVPLAAIPEPTGAHLLLVAFASWMTYRRLR